MQAGGSWITSTGRYGDNAGTSILD